MEGSVTSYITPKYHTGDQTKKNKRGTWGMEQGRERGEVYKKLWWGSLREGDHSKDLILDGKLISKWVSKK